MFTSLKVVEENANFLHLSSHIGLVLAEFLLFQAMVTS